jgi:hypothetical protein
MAKEQNKPQQDPAEGSREVIDRQLKRNETRDKESSKEPRGQPEDLASEEEGGGPA